MREEELREGEVGEGGRGMGVGGKVEVREGRRGRVGVEVVEEGKEY